MTAPSEAQNLRDAVVRDLGEHLISVGLGRKIGIREFEDFVTFALRPTGPIGAHIAKIKAERDEMERGKAAAMGLQQGTALVVAQLEARIADLVAALEAAWMAAEMRDRGTPDQGSECARAIASHIFSIRSALSNKDAGHE